MKEERIKVAAIELSEGVSPVLTDGGYDKYFTLIRMHSRPLCWIKLDVPGMNEMVPAHVISEKLMQAVGYRELSVLMGNVFSNETPVERLAPVSIVVCTHNRPGQLANCLTALFRLKYAEFEVIVVDNAPTDDATRRLVSGYPARYIREDQKGLDIARNTGIRAAGYDIIAFTDDDAEVDQYWLRAIGKAFTDTKVMAVSGFVAPASLDTKAQQDFEFTYGGMGHGFYPKSFSSETHKPTRLLWAGSLGVGVNMAFRKEVFDALGGFDISLDAGTATRGGGDIEMLFRTVSGNRLLHYVPDAVVWHTHRQSRNELSRQIEDNGCSFACFLITCAAKRYYPFRTIAGFFVSEWLVRRLLRLLIMPGKKGLRRLIWFEFKGMLMAPAAYLKARRHAKTLISKGTPSGELLKKMNTI